MWLLLEWPIARIFTPEKKNNTSPCRRPGTFFRWKASTFFFWERTSLSSIVDVFTFKSNCFFADAQPFLKAVIFFGCSAPSPADCKQRSNIKTAGFRAQLLAWGTGSRCEDMCSNILIYTVCDYSSESNWLERPHRSLCSKSHEKFSHLCFCIGFSLLIDLLCSSAAQAYQMFVT